MGLIGNFIKILRCTASKNCEPDGLTLQDNEEKVLFITQSTTKLLVNDWKGNGICYVENPIHYYWPFQTLKDGATWEVQWPSTFFGGDGYQPCRWFPGWEAF